MDYVSHGVTIPPWLRFTVERSFGHDMDKRDASQEDRQGQVVQFPDSEVVKPPSKRPACPFFARSRFTSRRDPGPQVVNLKPESLARSV